MNIDQVSVQLYTVRDFLNTAEDFQESLQKIADIGYKSVEVAGPRPVGPGEIASLCAEKGLVIASSHEDPTELVENPAGVAETLEAFGCRFTVYPFPVGLDHASEQAWRQMIADLEHSGRVLHESGKVLAYHNHDLELAEFNDRPVLEMIYAESDAQYLQAELDTYWIHSGNASPEAWCAALRNRLPLIHLKDFAQDEDGKPYFAEIGSGVLDFKTIVAAAEVSGCRWYIVEQDVCPGDPFVSLEKSYRYI
jgi:sugar phosphate isomerase/epimerase